MSDTNDLGTGDGGASGEEHVLVRDAAWHGVRIIMTCLHCQTDVEAVLKNPDPYAQQDAFPELAVECKTCSAQEGRRCMIPVAIFAGDDAIEGEVGDEGDGLPAHGDDAPPFSGGQVVDLPSPGGDDEPTG